jgi:hypothetical protein
VIWQAMVQKICRNWGLYNVLEVLFSAGVEHTQVMGIKTKVIPLLNSGV